MVTGKNELKWDLAELNEVETVSQKNTKGKTKT